MINIDSLSKPSILQVLDYETILNELIENHKTRHPDWEPLEGDDHLMMLEDFAYRELHLRAEFNNLANAFFLSSSTGTNLDNYAVFYGVERLQGAKPYQTYEFTLSEALSQDVTVPKDLVLTDKTNSYEAKLLDDVLIAAGETTATGTVELQLEIDKSEIKTEVITTTLPFVVEAKATGIFDNGSSVEDDEAFRQRILLSMADKSTAGSEETYKSFTFSADERIEDVVIKNGGAGIVNVYYYSETSDQLMEDRITEKLNAKEVRPITDNVVIQAVTEIEYTITAELKILPNQESTAVYNNAIENLKAGLKSLKKIGTDITLSEINDFLKVPGVKEVVISAPTQNVQIEDNQIGVNGENTITYTII